MKFFKLSKLALFPSLFIFYEIINYFANDMYLPALPSIVSNLHTTVYSAQQTITIWFLGGALPQLFLEPLAKRLGTKFIFFAGGIIFVVATCLCSLAPNVHILLIARFFQGAAACSMGVITYLMMLEVYEHQNAAKILMMMSSIIIFTPVFGALLGSIILLLGTWRSIFVVLMICAIIALLLLWFLMKEISAKEKKETINWKLLKKDYLSILTNGNYVLNSCIFGAIFIGLMAWIIAGPFMVITEFRKSNITFGIFQLMIFGSLVVGFYFAKLWQTRKGVEPTVNLGFMLVLAGGILAFLLTLVLPHFLFGLIASFMVYTFGSALLFTFSNRIAVKIDKELLSSRLVIFNTFISICGILGGLLVGSTYNGNLIWFGVLLIVTSSLACFLKWIEMNLET